MKVIFLDIDGPLITHRSVLAVKDMIVDPISVQLLNRVLSDFDAKIVLTSTHRLQFMGDNNPLASMQEYLTTLGVLGERCIAYLPHDSKRGHGISVWLANNNVESYIVLDDSDHAVKRQDGSLNPELDACFIHVDQRIGISERNYRDMTALFGDPDTGAIFL